MKMRHFFHLKSIFFCFVNILAFVLFLFCLKPSYLFFKCLLKNCFFGRRETVCLTEPQDFFFFYIDNHKRHHSWPVTFCGQLGRSSPLDVLDNS